MLSDAKEEVEMGGLAYCVRQAWPKWMMQLACMCSAATSSTQQLHIFVGGGGGGGEHDNVMTRVLVFYAG